MMMHTEHESESAEGERGLCFNTSHHDRFLVCMYFST